MIQIKYKIESNTEANSISKSNNGSNAERMKSGILKKKMIRCFLKNDTNCSLENKSLSGVFMIESASALIFLYKGLNANNSASKSKSRSINVNQITKSYVSAAAGIQTESFGTWAISK